MECLGLIDSVKGESKEINRLEEFSEEEVPIKVFGNINKNYQSRGDPCQGNVP